MFVLLAILNNVFKTYLDSLKRDLGGKGFQMVLMLALLSWTGILIIVGLLMRGQFEMPIFPLFYLYWFGLTFLTLISFTLFLVGLLNTSLFAASSFGNIGFVMTAVYAVLFLGEQYASYQIVAIVTTVVGALVLLKRKGSNDKFKWDKGLLLILFSLIISPIEYVLYKLATLHASSYHQFLTGRLVMDLVFYSLFALIISAVWYHKNPLPQIVSFTSSRSGVLFLFGTMVAELLESWIIFNIPISLFAIVGTLSIPSAYFIGRIKYKELHTRRHVIGAVMICLGVISFMLGG